MIRADMNMLAKSFLDTPEDLSVPAQKGATENSPAL
jgi:hypothetical protein